jgi:hypothetical protein
MILPWQCGVIRAVSWYGFDQVSPPSLLSEIAVVADARLPTLAECQHGAGGGYGDCGDAVRMVAVLTGDKNVGLLESARPDP